MTVTDGTRKEKIEASKCRRTASVCMALKGCKAGRLHLLQGVRCRLASTEHRPDCGNRGKQPDDRKGGFYSLPLLCSKPLGEKERDSSAKHGARADGEGEFWKAEMGFFHNNRIRSVRDDVKRRRWELRIANCELRNCCIDAHPIRNLQSEIHSSGNMIDNGFNTL
jgi:hypothetical protein